MTIEIHTLADDELITETGLYRMSLDRHHGQPCDGVSITSGVLRRIEKYSPADAWAFHQLNPDRWEDEDKTALRQGRAMAAYVEGGEEEVLKHFLVLPDDRPRRPTRDQLNAIKEGRASQTAKRSVAFWREIDTDPRDTITEREWSLIKDMGRVLAADPGAQAALSGLPEITMAWKDERTGIWCLARPDTINFDGTVTDYKKISSQGRPFSDQLLNDRIIAGGYDMQLGFGAEGMEQVGIGWPSMAAIVAQWDQRPHHVRLHEIQEEDLRIGQFLNHEALYRFAECLQSGHWPAPGESVGVFRRTDAQREALIERMQIAGKAP
ncbi:MAG: hypothetical protein EP341_03775 [Sphingomonadales bacterium]|nr:MAG: hypothetical protein EP341_03775 [Sphingomonadales bacterium]